MGGEKRESSAKNNRKWKTKDREGPTMILRREEKELEDKKKKKNCREK